MTAAAQVKPSDFDDDIVTEVVPMFVDRAGRTAYDRRQGDRRGSGIRVHWFHGDRRGRDRRGLQRRGEERMPVCLELEEVVGKYTFYRYTADISADGISVRHAVPHEKETLLLLKFELPDEQEEVPVRCWARVVGVREDGLGMRYRFVGMSRADQWRINRFVDALSLSTPAQ